MNTLQQYFGLQLIMFKRQIIEFGLNPILGFIIILSAFYGFSIFLFSKIEYANYIFILIAFIGIYKHREIFDS